MTQIVSRKCRGTQENTMTYLTRSYYFKGLDGRYYQADRQLKYTYTPTRKEEPSQEEKKEKADKMTTVGRIRRIEAFLGGADAQTPVKEVEAAYGLFKHKDKFTYGDAAAVFALLKEKFQAASYYKGFMDVLMSLNNGQPVRTEPLRIIHVKG